MTLITRFGLLAIAAIGLAQAQQFDVATIKPNPETDDNFMFRPSTAGVLNAVGVTLKLLVMQAYNVKGFQVSGGAEWTGRARWDLQAKADGVEGRIPVEQERKMLLALLEDRFQLKAHHETKEMPVYALVLGKNGSKLQRSAETDTPGVRQGPGSFTAKKTAIAFLATRLSFFLGRTVIDQTNLAGEYNFTLEWSGEQPGGPEALGLPSVAEPPKLPNPNGPSLVTAVQEQLGLRLDSRRGPVDVIVIDRAEKPSGN